MSFALFTDGRGKEVGYFRQKHSVWLGSLGLIRIARKRPVTVTRGTLTGRLQRSNRASLVGGWSLLLTFR